jgi:DNA recombination protein RmuC
MGQVPMIEWLVLFTGAIALVAAIFAFLAFQRAGRPAIDGKALGEGIATLTRSEGDRVRASAEEQGRALRQELGDNIRGFQETTLKAFRELGDGLGSHTKDFGGRLDAGLQAIDGRAAAIGSKLDGDIARMAEEATRSRDTLRHAIEGKLDDAATRQAVAAKEAREEITGSFRQLNSGVADTLSQVGAQQKERLDNVTAALNAYIDKQDKAQEALRRTVEERLDAIRSVNEAKLEEMRKTVDEKLQSTLDARIGQSFKLVGDQLEKVSTGLIEMQQLATGVGDLKRVLTQVKLRGTWGETQLGSLLEDFLAPDQFCRNSAVNPATDERVEFAIRLPRLADGQSEVLLPIDAKFPFDIFSRLVEAAESSDPARLEDAAVALERVVRLQAKDIATKYICPPNTTDYAVMFLPSEALYAEVARRPGLVDGLSREHAVMIAGPSTLIALLNAIRVGFRSAVIHRQAGEIAKLLQRVRSEFEKYGKAVQHAYTRATRTVDAISKLQTRQNVMGRALKGVDLLAADTPLDAATMMLELETRDLEEGDLGDETIQSEHE